ncbi:predicted protein [Postia placenta Mad-698-R]|uniref:Uncharacterized protein n=1 Tax=Postia placenta MAD-698-R-SB12 TaxID=670580 RepID=A0A1X6MY32_9APHY|nr:hypothetical protein POSPLADRAFT_1147153 [Postia placenta MAD-698-R-SB12]EED81179.1 predicted protein [Postia placenta Mad-698-R]OSX61294.1 hypothetical protein POSPLADRAFT_1147153 [Postia placenta MAD-698-R-SB12]
MSPEQLEGVRRLDAEQLASTVVDVFSSEQKLEELEDGPSARMLSIDFWRQYEVLLCGRPAAGSGPLAQHGSRSRVVYHHEKGHKRVQAFLRPDRIRYGDRTSPDIYSFNNEQARGDTHNMIAILINSQGLGMQDAIDYAGDLCKQTMNVFTENKDLFPSCGAAVDADVQVYVQGLQDWIVGKLHWSFVTERYFEKRGAEIKATRVLEPYNIGSNIDLCVAPLPPGI